MQQPPISYLSKEFWQKVSSECFEYYQVSSKYCSEKYQYFSKHYFSPFYQWGKAFYFVAKAFSYGVSSHLPFSTLKLIGEKLSRPESHDKMVKLLESKEVPYQSGYITLTDPVKQEEIRAYISSIDCPVSSDYIKAA
jgi:hypothetical protein